MRNLPLLFLLLSFWGCTPKPSAYSDKTVVPLPIPSAWQLQYCELDGKKIPAANASAFLAIHENSLSGHSGCNAFGGDWTGSPEEMAVPGVMATKRFCADAAEQERLIFALLNGTVKCLTSDGQTLEVMAGERKMVLSRNDKLLR